MGCKILIVCNNHQFIFIKTRKTAGTSVEIALSRNCGPGDIVTTLSEKRGEEDLRREEGGFGPDRWQKGVFEHRGAREWRRLIKYGERAPRFERHATASDVRRVLGEHVWDSYYCFTVERNPWDRAVSRYWWDCGKGRRSDLSQAPPLSDYLRHLADEKPFKLSNWEHYAIDEHILVDRVLLFENLQADLDDLRGRLMLPASLSLPRSRAKGTSRPPSQNYRDVLSRQDRDLISRVRAREIEAFGYEF